ncbi:hypothetical protein BDV38DRAFT_234972 [Aspergillus pseudotamarii]|uniref:Uncharacterized protein n=1 Tax=Aspergillus pseudotamarii TaxID=132259 RepID=A0A5N6T822_ASPPS|nr:uncharacterized protein BDV38DRAFT_234972 [Aspergillus pseudotamarii]KAE8142528.1 hypothetical protein BDV38DRAFT_234972 [Aspergillus pseudotamarii]
MVHRYRWTLVTRYQIYRSNEVVISPIHLSFSVFVFVWTIRKARSLHYCIIPYIPCVE